MVLWYCNVMKINSKIVKINSMKIPSNDVEIRKGLCKSQVSVCLAAGQLMVWRFARRALSGFTRQSTHLHPVPSVMRVPLLGGGVHVPRTSVGVSVRCVPLGFNK